MGYNVGMHPGLEEQGGGRVALTAVGADQPGIVSALTGALEDLGCNLEDSTMSILRGHFAVLLVVSAPDGTDEATLEAALARVATEKHLVITVRPFSEEAEAVGSSASPIPGSPAVSDRSVSSDERVGSAYTLSIHGADRPGIVYHVATSLADVGGNVVGLSTRLIGEPDQPVYVMVLTASFPEGVDGEAATARVHRAAAEMDVQCRVHPADADVL